MADLEEQFERLRRSAACAPLSAQQVAELIEVADALVHERRDIRSVLGKLPASFHEVRRSLNELSRLVG